MNVRRRFLLGTVLSIQNRSFIYPACRSCCSQLILTSCRYECHKCGRSYMEAAHRYKLCLKVSEERRLHIITVFGTGVEKLFGGSADSLHSNLQVPSGDLEHGDAQDLLFQAAERCLIGRSFIFAVKMPENADRSDPLNLIACQIILLDDDPTSCTILSYFNQLLAPVRNSINANTDVSTEATNRNLEFSEGDSSLHPSWSHYANYWQQSLGLVSSPLSNTLSQQCNFRPSECIGAEPVPHPEALTSLNTTLSTQKKIKGADTVARSSSIVSISTPRVKRSSSNHLHMDASRHSPQCSSHLQSFSSKSKMAFGQESYLQNICKSGSQQSQSCSTHMIHGPPPPAQIHQAKEEIWEDFPFSESLSEFIAKIEDHEDVRLQLAARESTTSTSDGKEGRRPSCSLMNLPDGQPTPNYKVGKQTPNCSFAEESNTRVSNHQCKGTRRDGTDLVALTFPSADLSTFQESFEKSNLLDALSRASAKEQNWQSPTCPKMLSNGMYISDRLDISSFIDYLEKSVMTLGNPISSGRHGGDDEPKSSDEGNRKIPSEVKSTMTRDNYNASADLFEASNNPEDDGTSQSQRIDRGQGRLLLPITDSPCRDVLPHRHRVSRMSLSSSLAKWNILPVGDFIPNMQSTPILRRLSQPNRLAVDTWRFNTGSNSKSSTVSIRTKSTSSIRYIFLKNMRQRKSAIFYGLSENYSLWSPTLPPILNSEGSTALTPKYRRTMVDCQPWKGGTVWENTEDYSPKESDDNRRLEETKTGREESIQHGGDALKTSEHLPPGNRLLQEGEDGLCSSQLLPSDWSPELFSGKLNVSLAVDRLQRRLF